MTAVQSTPEVEPDSATPGGDATRRAKFDALALQQLLAPVRRATAKAQRIQWIASAATVVPFVGIVELGRVLLSDGPVNTARVWTIVGVVVGALGDRTGIRLGGFRVRRVSVWAPTAPTTGYSTRADLVVAHATDRHEL